MPIDNHETHVLPPAHDTATDEAVCAAVLRPVANPGPHHQSWLTPKESVLDPLVRALGPIGLDPCSPGAGLSNVDAVVHYVADPADPAGGGLMCFGVEKGPC